MNGIMFQAFEWYLEDDGNYYTNMIAKLDQLQEIGITAIWLPPVYKATGTNDAGYGPYDLYDLGEFDQKGSIRTKYGTKEQLKKLIEEIHNRKMSVYADVVLNHKAGADEAETFMAVMVDENDRNKEVEAPKEIKAWTKFNYEARKNKYSSFKWNYTHFNGVDYDDFTGVKAIYRILGENKGWSYGVSSEHGNYDYLMFANVDFAHPDVKDELKQWALWFINELDLDGFRMDALKHMDNEFVHELLSFIYNHANKDFYIIGEYWSTNIKKLHNFFEVTRYQTDLFDVVLHFNLYQASKEASTYDLRKIFDHTLVVSHPKHAVTFVDNHDSQPNESLESFIDDWFKPIAYGLILLRKDGYPCIFYGDYFGILGEHPHDDHQQIIDVLAKVRLRFAYGDQDDYFDEPTCIGWVRHGNDRHPNKCAVIISSQDANAKRMFVGQSEQGKIYADYTGNNDEKITIDDDGYGHFKVSAGSISVWIEDGLKL